MSTNIDNRVVEMRFENKDFEKNASESMTTLDKLKQKLNFNGAAKGFETINTAAKRVNLDGVGSGVDALRVKFSALEVVTVTTLANITNSAINAGKRITSALTIDPIKTGFNEYEIKMGSVQTILANTQHEGTKLKDVTRALDELNLYADKTIYNFQEMTRNIGTFTAAGVGLDKSVTSIKGIANLAAISGSTSVQASTAMYQLSQALAAGKVSLMDWNSVVNAGMGGKVFQDALKRTAEHAGTDVDALIKKYGSFRESLTQGNWLTAEVLTETLTQLSGAYSEADLIAQGYTKKQAKEIIELAKTAESAATEVKTFTQLWDTLKESAQSGWAQTWELIVGDFDEAKELLTNISNVVGGAIGKTADARNKLLEGWKDMGGRKDLIEGLTNVFSGLMSVLKPIGQAFREIFPATTPKQLKNITEGFKNLTENFKLADSTAEKLKRTFAGLFSIIDFFRKIVNAIAKGIGNLFTSGGVSGMLDLILSFTAAIGDVFTSINNGFEGKGIAGLFTGITEVISGALHGLTGFGDALSGVGKMISDVIGGIVSAFKSAFTWISENISVGNILAGFAGGGIYVAGKKLAGLFENLGGLLEKIGDITGKGILGIIFGDNSGSKLEEVSVFKEVLESVNEALGAFTNGIKIGSLLAIAGAITILSAALKNVSELRVQDITKSLSAVGVMFAMLTTSFKSINKSISLFAGKGVVKTGIAMMMMAKSIDILAGSVKTLSELKFSGIAKGLVGIGGGMTVLALGLRAVNNLKIRISTIVALSTLAKALKTIGETLSELGSMSWKRIAQGLTAMGGALAELMITLKILEKIGSMKGLLGSISLVIAVQSLDKIASALSKIGKLSWNGIAKGISGLGIALTELAVLSGLFGKFAGFSGLIGATGISIAAESLADIAMALKSIGNLSWKAIAKGLTGIGGVLTELSVVSGVLGKFGGFASIIGATTITIMADSLTDIAKAFQPFAKMSWKQIKMGLTGMGGALLEIGAIAGALGKLAGLSGLIGSASILIVTKGLSDIASALKDIGALSWSEIGRGLAGMGTALLEIGAISGALGVFAGLPALLGSGAILIAAKGLGDIADALKKFGEMSWSEIGRGLTAMGAALSEVALGGLMNTLSGLGAKSIATIAEPLGILADSVKKWSGVTVPENLSTQLSGLASGIRSFTFGGFGASVISEVASPLGILADSVKKWSGVTVPENLSTQLSGLANGVKSFSFAFMGGWSISTVAEPLGALANAVKKWSGVTVPENLDTQLSNLASGVRSFSFAFMGGWSLEVITGPLGKLAASVKKWNGVSIPEGLPIRLKELATSLKYFSGVSDLSNISEGISSIASAVVKFASVNFETIKSGLQGFADSINKLNSSKTSLQGLGNSIAENIITPINNLNSKLKSAGTKLMSSLASGIRSSSAAKSAAVNIINSISKTITAKVSSFRNAGSKMGSAIAKGISSKNGEIRAASVSGLSAGVAAIRAYRNSFYSAGAYIAQGLANGINSKKSAIQSAASAIAAAADVAARARLKINSPSKVFMEIGSGIPEGFIVGIKQKTKEVKNAVYYMGTNAFDSMKKSISNLSGLVDSDIESQPTIQPILDLTKVKSGISDINGMFGMTPSVGLLSNVNTVSASMSRKNQNDFNNDVISAIKKLGKDISNIGGNSYNINGVSYEEGTDVADAFATLIRAAKIERRI